MNILFLGEKAEASSTYVLDSLDYLGHSYDYFSSDDSLPRIKKGYDSIIISDYPSRKVTPSNSRRIDESISSGTRFVMIGGWTSFNGMGNSYKGHPLEKILPVTLLKSDDRRDVSQGLLICRKSGSCETGGLDWDSPPVICGYNHTKAKNTSSVLVDAKPILSDCINIGFGKPVPMVVKGVFGKGDTVACMTDLAPHWCGGLVDWGNKRLKLKHVEIGNMFPLFVQFLLTI